MGGRERGERTDEGGVWVMVGFVVVRGGADDREAVGDGCGNGGRGDVIFCVVFADDDDDEDEDVVRTFSNGVNVRIVVVIVVAVVTDAMMTKFVKLAPSPPMSYDC